MVENKIREGILLLSIQIVFLASLLINILLRDYFSVGFIFVMIITASMILGFSYIHKIERDTLKKNV